MEKTPKLTEKSTHLKGPDKLWTLGWQDPEVTQKRLNEDLEAGEEC